MLEQERRQGDDEETIVKLEGTQQFTQGPEELYRHLTDLSFMARCIPDLEKVEHPDADTMVCRVRPGFSFLRGKLDVTFKILDRQPPNGATMRMVGKGIGNQVTVETALGITPHGTGAGSELHWSAEVTERTGLLKSVSPALIQAAAHKLISDSWSSVRDEMESGTV